MIYLIPLPMKSNILYYEMKYLFPCYLIVVTWPRCFLLTLLPFQCFHQALAVIQLSMSRVWFAQSVSSQRLVCVLRDLSWYLCSSYKCLTAPAPQPAIVLPFCLGCFSVFTSTAKCCFILHRTNGDTTICVVRKADADSPGHFHNIGRHFVFREALTARLAVVIEGLPLIFAICYHSLCSATKSVSGNSVHSETQWVSSASRIRPSEEERKTSDRAAF